MPEGGGAGGLCGPQIACAARHVLHAPDAAEVELAAEEVRQARVELLGETTKGGHIPRGYNESRFSHPATSHKLACQVLPSWL